MDGQSQDNSTAIFRKYNHLKWVSEPDRGQSDAMNKAFRMCSGDIVVYLNADDEFKVGAFEAVVDAFVQSDADMIVGQLEMKFENGFSKVKNPSVNLNEIILYWPCRFPGNPVSYFYRRQVQQNIGDFPLSNHFTMDYWFLLRAYQRCAIHKIDQILGTFHITENNKSANVERSRRSLRATRNEFLAETKSIEYVSVVIKDQLIKAIKKISGYKR